MPVSAYVVRCLPADQARLRRDLAALPGVRLGGFTDTGFALAVDTDTNREAGEFGDRLQAVPGVKAAVLVYHNFEDVVADPGGAGEPAGPLASNRRKS